MLTQDNAATKIQLKTKVTDIDLKNISLDRGEPLVNTKNNTLVVATNQTTADGDVIILGQGHNEIENAGENQLSLQHFDGDYTTPGSTHIIEGKSIALTADADNNITLDASYKLTASDIQNSAGAQLDLTDSLDTVKASVMMESTNGLDITKSSDTNIIFNINISDICDLIYPVGSIYLTIEKDENPASRFPGTTWERIAEGRTLFSASSYSNSPFTAGTTGGDQYIQTDNLPEHSEDHDISHTHELTVSAKRTEGLGSQFAIPSISDGSSLFKHVGNVPDSDPITSGIISIGRKADISTHAILWAKELDKRGDVFYLEADHTHTINSDLETFRGTAQPTDSSKNIDYGTVGKEYYPPYLACFMWKRTA